MYKAQLAQKPLSNQEKSAWWTVSSSKTPNLTDYSQNKGDRT